MGASVGLMVGKYLPLTLEEAAMQGLGLVVGMIGVRMFFQTKNAVIIVAAVALGGVLGVLLGITPALNWIAEMIRNRLGGGGRFDEALVSTTVLFCVGPMTIMGCLQDGIEGNCELLATKSMLDGIGSVFFAATLGVGVLVSAAVVLLVQGTLTLLAKSLRHFLTDQRPIEEASAAGGAMILGIGLNLLGLKHMHVEVYAPSLVLAPLFFQIQNGLSARKANLEVKP